MDHGQVLFLVKIHQVIFFHYCTIDFRQFDVMASFTPDIVPSLTLHDGSNLDTHNFKESQH